MPSLSPHLLATRISGRDQHRRQAGPGPATEKDYTIILLDIKMPNIDGIEFLERLREKKPDVPVLIITGYPSIPNAAAAMRLGPATT